MNNEILPENKMFKNKTVWITGASSGIGEALTYEFIKQGSNVVLSARNKTELQRVKTQCLEIGALPSQVLILPLDIIDYDAMPACVEKVISTFGQIDMLINNAGISQRSFCLDTDMDVYRTMFEVNVLGQIALTKQILPLMIKQNSGHMVVTSSVAGKVGAPLRTGYCAAKHAVMGFFDALRTEVAHEGIKVTTITPGFIRTNVSKNALDGKGNSTNKDDDDIANGMPVEECARYIMNGFLTNVEEIAVGSGEEMGILTLKSSEPTQVFRIVEQMADQIREKLNS